MSQTLRLGFWCALFISESGSANLFANGCKLFDGIAFSIFAGRLFSEFETDHHHDHEVSPSKHKKSMFCILLCKK